MGWFFTFEEGDLEQDDGAAATAPRAYRHIAEIPQQYQTMVERLVDELVSGLTGTKAEDLNGGRLVWNWGTPTQKSPRLRPRFCPKPTQAPSQSPRRRIGHPINGTGGFPSRHGCSPRRLKVNFLFRRRGSGPQNKVSRVSPISSREIRYPDWRSCRVTVTIAFGDREPPLFKSH